jgi:hypothetical protein
VFVVGNQDAGSMGAPTAAGDMSPRSIQLSSEPPLYAYKQLIVVIVLSAVAIVVTAPCTPNGSALWFLAFFTSINLFNAFGQAARMISAVRKLRARVLPHSSGSDAFLGDASGVVSIACGSCCGGRPAPACGCGNQCGDDTSYLLLRVDDAPAWRHVFVIPNFREDLEVLAATLDRLASHRHATHYTILLAMEEKEAAAERKAVQLQERFCLRFKAILFTLHSLDPVNEMPGKASNVNAAVRQFAATVPPSDHARYLLTIMDADALVPPAYVTQLEATTADVGSSAADHVYAAPVLFEQNGAEVPSLVRVTDFTWAALAMQNLNNWTGVGFPISNYSLSLALATSMGYWDTWCGVLGAAGPEVCPTRRQAAGSQKRMGADWHAAISILHTLNRFNALQTSVACCLTPLAPNRSSLLPAPTPSRS